LRVGVMGRIRGWERRHELGKETRERESANGPLPWKK
jgi:hypothetical protein